jgi:hypothetical protein
LKLKFETFTSSYSYNIKINDQFKMHWIL